jgi:hypothetical protein
MSTWALHFIQFVTEAIHSLIGPASFSQRYVTSSTAGCLVLVARQRTPVMFVRTLRSGQWDSGYLGLLGQFRVGHRERY